MTPASTFDVTPAGPRHVRALRTLFEEADCPCHCRWWHFTGDKNEWLDRCANASEVNRDELATALSEHTADAHGLVATFSDASNSDPAAGWLKVAPISAVAKAYDQKLYRGLPCFGGDRTGVFLVACVLIHPRARRSGLATRMVRTAVELSPSWGATALEGLPRRPNEPVNDGELWTVPFRAFEENGFEVVHDFAPYPVVRREVGRHV